MDMELLSKLLLYCRTEPVSVDHNSTKHAALKNVTAAALTGLSCTLKGPYDYKKGKKKDKRLIHTLHSLKPAFALYF